MGIHKSIFICQAQCALQMYNRRPIGTPKILQFSTRDCLLLLYVAYSIIPKQCFGEEQYIKKCFANANLNLLNNFL